MSLRAPIAEAHQRKRVRCVIQRAMCQSRRSNLRPARLAERYMRLVQTRRLFWVRIPGWVLRWDNLFWLSPVTVIGDEDLQ